MHKDILTLNIRDLKGIYAVALCKFLSSVQLAHVCFPNAIHEHATRRLTTLTKHKYLSRVFSSPKATDAHKGGHPTAVYYWSPENKKHFQHYLESKGLAELFSDFEPLTPTDNNNDRVSQLSLVHELGISDIFICVEASAIRSGWTILFWERTSPFSRDIREEFIIETTKSGANGRTYTTTEKLFFNPDGVLGLQDPEGYKYFLTIEYDNDSCTIQEYNKKLRGCIEYRTRKLFPQLTTHYANKYGFKVENPNVGWRVLNITPDTQRRNALFQDSLSLHAYKYLMFASMTDIQPDGFLSAVWLRGKEYPINNPELMPRVSLVD